MRKILLLVFVAGCFSVKAQNIDVLHYKYIIGLSDETDTLNGLAIITFVHQNKNQNVSFDLTSLNKEGKGMKVYFVSADAQSSSSLNFSQSADKILLSTPQLKKGDTSTLYIAYKGIPSDGLIISKNKYGDRTFFADNWPNRAHYWLPCNDRPDDKAMFEFRITAPSHYRVISNGIINGEKILGNGLKRTIWKEDTPLSTKMMVIGVAKFATKTYEDSPPNIPVSAWVYPQDSAKGFYDFAVAPSILKFFADYIGPFPYKKLANVQSKTIFGGMENASCIFYAENSITGDRSKEDLMAHEIAHQWFGDMVSEKSFAHLWLSEGFADYFENYYFEKKYGEEAAREKWIEAREEVIAFATQSKKPVVDSTEDLMSLLNANSYKKGAWVLRMLRYEVGDSVFHNIIRTYYNQYKGSNAETRDFEAVAEKVSGKELTWFFDQWLYQAGIPKLGLSWEYNNKSIRIVPYTLIMGYDYTFPIEVQVVYKDGSSEIRDFPWSPIGHYRTSFSAKEKPVKIILDPNKKLLFEEIKK